MEQQLATPAPVASTSVKLVIGLFFAILGVVLTLDNLTSRFSICGRSC